MPPQARFGLPFAAMSRVTASNPQRNPEVGTKKACWGSARGGRLSVVRAGAARHLTNRTGGFASLGMPEGAGSEQSGTQYRSQRRHPVSEKRPA